MHGRFRRCIVPATDSRATESGRAASLGAARESRQIRKKYCAGLQCQPGAKGLGVNVAALWNTLYAQAALSLLEAMGDDVLEADVARLSPLRWRHINALGRFDFRLQPGVEGEDVRPLRDPNALSALELAWLNDEE